MVRVICIKPESVAETDDYELHAAWFVVPFGSAHHILLQLEVSPLEKSAELKVTLRTGTVAVEQKLNL